MSQHRSPVQKFDNFESFWYACVVGPMQDKVCLSFDFVKQVASNSPLRNMTIDIIGKLVNNDKTIEIEVEGDEPFICNTKSIARNQNWLHDLLIMAFNCHQLDNPATADRVLSHLLHNAPLTIQFTEKYRKKLRPEMIESEVNLIEKLILEGNHTVEIEKDDHTILVVDQKSIKEKPWKKEVLDIYQPVKMANAADHKPALDRPASPEMKSKGRRGSFNFDAPAAGTFRQEQAAEKKLTRKNSTPRAAAPAAPQHNHAHTFKKPPLPQRRADKNSQDKKPRKNNFKFGPHGAL